MCLFLSVYWFFIAWLLFSWATADREYEARLERYSERIWTCKSTGSSQLTHKEAWEEEQEVAELWVAEALPFGTIFTVSRKKGGDSTNP